MRMSKAKLVRSKTNLLKQFFRTGLAFRNGSIQEPQSKRDVLLYRPVRHQPEFLDDVPDLPPQGDRIYPADLFPFDHNFAARGL